ncbi:MAG: hypothetical protein QGI93_03820 [Planctomycetota bacterium]|jgi:hypothetical protein|nr:hypothetical protein [Planctomycetota bacterium]MDP6740933.1 hypothetical protein [Planctomycetota bacterium]MDP6938939.1 hypothetical protein [Planctomycetota bacterium]
MQLKPLHTLLALGLTASAFGDTWVIDDDPGPGVDFPDIPQAIAASHSGDVLLIRPGAYSAFTLSKGLTLLGSKGATVASGARIQSMPARQTAILTDLTLDNLLIKACDGPILLDRIKFKTLGTKGNRLWIDNSLDVRVHRTSATSRDAWYTAALVVSSRVEFVECTFRGGREYDDNGEAGGPAMRINQSRVHFALPNIVGGRGDDNWTTCGFPNSDAGDGGPGCKVAGSELFVSGRQSDRIKGGFAGYGEQMPCDGYGGDGITMCGGSVLYHQGIPAGGDSDGGGSGYAVNLDCGATGSSPSWAAPSLQRTGADNETRIVIHGAPGGSVRLYGGSEAIVQNTAPSKIEWLTRTQWVKDLGTLNSKGTMTYTFDGPHRMKRDSKGAHLVLQVTVVDPSGVTQRSNSLPVILR